MLLQRGFQPKIVGVERNGASLRKPMPLYYTSLPPFSQLIFTRKIIYYFVFTVVRKASRNLFSGWA